MPGGSTRNGPRNTPDDCSDGASDDRSGGSSRRGATRRPEACSDGVGTRLIGDGIAICGIRVDLHVFSVHVSSTAHEEQK